MQFNEKGLRMGRHIDSGNIDFIREGYGGERTIMVDPASISDVKQDMKAKGLSVRVQQEEVVEQHVEYAYNNR